MGTFSYILLPETLRKHDEAGKRGTAFCTESRGISFVVSAGIRVNSLSCNNIAKYMKIYDNTAHGPPPPRKKLSKMLEGSKQKLGDPDPPTPSQVIAPLPVMFSTNMHL